jgi:hypothetical protein
MCVGVRVRVAVLGGHTYNAHATPACSTTRERERVTTRAREREREREIETCMQHILRACCTPATAYLSLSLSLFLSFSLSLSLSLSLLGGHTYYEQAAEVAAN